MRYPYILPSVVSGVLSLISWLVALFFLKESNKAVIQRKQAAQKEHELKDLSTSECLLSSEPTEGHSETLKEPKEMLEFQPPPTLILLAEEHEGDGNDDGDVSLSPPSKSRSLLQAIRATWSNGGGVLPTTQSRKYTHITEEDSTISSASAPTPSSGIPTTSEPEDPTKGGINAVLLILKDRSVMVSIVLLALASLSVVAVDEVFPLWASNKPPVGLGMYALSVIVHFLYVYVY